MINGHHRFLRFHDNEEVTKEQVNSHAREITLKGSGTTGSTGFGGVWTLTEGLVLIGFELYFDPPTDHSDMVESVQR